VAAFIGYRYLKHREGQRRLELIHAERLAAMDKGIPLPVLKERGSRMSDQDPFDRVLRQSLGGDAVPALSGLRSAADDAAASAAAFTGRPAGAAGLRHRRARPVGRSDACRVRRLASLGAGRVAAAGRRRRLARAAPAA